MAKQKKMKKVSRQAEVHACFTGSYVYGKPKKDSDIDLVVLVSKVRLQELKQLADNRLQLERALASTRYADTDNASLRFGKLNLICVTDPMRMIAWKKGTIILKTQRPVVREEACKLFTKLFKSHD